MWLMQVDHWEDSIPNQLGIPPMRLPVMSVNYTPFGIGALSLAVQFYVGCVQAGVALPRATPHSFLKVDNTYSNNVLALYNVVYVCAYCRTGSMFCLCSVKFYNYIIWMGQRICCALASTAWLLSTQT